jgi:hypothetical protein
VVTVAGNGHRQGRIDPADLDPEQGDSYRFSTAYNRAKLANLLFTYELDRRLKAVAAPTIVVAGHPGLARTDGRRKMDWVVRAALNPKVNPLMLKLSQSATKGALEPLRAATDPHARWRLLRPTGARSAHRPSRAGHLHRVVPRRRLAAAVVGGIRAADECCLSASSIPEK